MRLHRLLRAVGLSAAPVVAVGLSVAVRTQQVASCSIRQTAADTRTLDRNPRILRVTFPKCLCTGVDSSRRRRCVTY